MPRASDVRVESAPGARAAVLPGRRPGRRTRRHRESGGTLMPTGRASIFSARNVLVVDTKCVPLSTDLHVIAYYEIHTAPDAAFPHPTVYITPDVDLYD